MKLLLLLLASLVAVSAEAKIVTRDVAYEHDGVKLEGYLAYDDALTGGAKLPGVLIIPEWWGVNDYVKSRARQIAGLGYVAFVGDMYGAGVATTDAKKAGQLAGQFYGKPLMAQRAHAGLDQLLAQPFVDPARIAAIGYCFGGATVQALAYSGAPLAGIVSFHGSLIPAPADADIKAKFLICHGALDSFTSQAQIDAFKQSLDAAKVDYVFVIYSGAHHAFTNPDADEVGKANGLDNVRYNANADHRSWQHMKDFFAEIFAKS